MKKIAFFLLVACHSLYAANNSYNFYSWYSQENFMCLQMPDIDNNYFSIAIKDVNDHDMRREQQIALKKVIAYLDAGKCFEKLKDEIKQYSLDINLIAQCSFCIITEIKPFHLSPAMRLLTSKHTEEKIPGFKNFFGHFIQWILAGGQNPEQYYPAIDFLCQHVNQQTLTTLLEPCMKKILESSFIDQWSLEKDRFFLNHKSEYKIEYTYGYSKTRMYVAHLTWLIQTLKKYNKCTSQQTKIEQSITQRIQDYNTRYSESATLEIFITP